MKKTALALTFALCLTALCGCGESSNSAPAPEANSSSAAATEAPKETAKETTTEPTKATTKATEAKKDESSSNGSKLKLTKYSPCVKIGNTYQSLSANFKFKAPEGWHFYSDEELLAMLKQFIAASGNSDAQKYLSFNTIDEMIANDWLIYDAMASNADSNGTIQFSFVNNIKEGADENVTTSAWINGLHKQLAPDSTINKVSFANQEYQYFTVKKDTQDANGNIVTLYTTYFLRAMGKYTYQITYASTNDDFETAILPNMGCVSETPVYQ